MILPLNLVFSNKTSTKIQDIQVLTITLVAPKINTKTHNQEFFKSQNIIPKHWKLAKNPIVNHNSLQLNFDSGVIIIVKNGKINFVEKNIGNPYQISAITRRYILKQSQLNYKALNISPRRLVSVPGNDETARKYITETLLNPGNWQYFGKSPLHARVNLIYKLDDCQLNLVISQAKLKELDNTFVPGLLFSGSFIYKSLPNKSKEKWIKLNLTLDKLYKNLKVFNKIINEKLLG